MSLRPASSYSAPPSFYLDEGLNARSLRRALSEAGYEWKNAGNLDPAGWSATRGIQDEQWLRLLKGSGCTVLTKDFRIYQRPHERQAWLRSGLHVFAFGGRDESFDTLLEVLELRFDDICARASSKLAGYWVVTRSGIRHISI